MAWKSGGLDLHITFRAKDPITMGCPAGLPSNGRAHRGNFVIVLKGQFPRGWVARAGEGRPGTNLSGWLDVELGQKGPGLFRQCRLKYEVCNRKYYETYAVHGTASWLYIEPNL